MVLSVGHRLNHHCVTSFAIDSDLRDIYLHENLQDCYFEVLKLALCIIYNPQYTENYNSQW